MKICIINISSRKGSTGRIVQILKNGYKNKGHDVFCIFGARDEKEESSDEYKIVKGYESKIAALTQRLTGYQGYGLACATRKAIGIIKREKPDVVQLLNIHGYYIDEVRLLEYLASNKIPVVYSMMDEYAYMGKCAFSYECEKFKDQCQKCPKIKDYPASLIFDRSTYYQNKKYKLYNSIHNIVFAAVPWVVWRAKQSRLLSGRQIETINEPIDLDSYFYPHNPENIRKELGIPEGNKVIMTATVLSSQRKGGRYFLQLCTILKDVPDVSFVYIGYNTEKYQNEHPDTMIKIPYVNSLDRLASLLSVADVFVCTSLSDTIPNACINALGCGTPVCGFDISGLSFIGIDDPELVKLVKPFDVDMLANTILSFNKKNENIIAKARSSVYENYNPNTIVNKYLELFNRTKK